MVLLTELPPEIIQTILAFVDASDLGWLPRTCKALYHSIKGNATLFKNVYLAHLDTPRAAQIDWEQNLKDMVRLRLVCERKGVQDKKTELGFVYNTAMQLLQNASSDGERASPSATHRASRNAQLLTELFRNEDNRHSFLGRSFIFERSRAEVTSASFSSPPKEDHQRSAHLHCLYGVPILYSSSARTRSGKMSPFACSMVYDLRQYTEKTKWGPFMDDGSRRVDWEKVEAIMIVLGANLKRLNLTSSPICSNFWDTPFAGVWRNSYLPLPAMSREPDALELDDPYDITGTWLRVVCFLDYSDFFSYNFSPEDQPPSNVPRPAINVGEATRLILMKIYVTAIEPPGPEDGQELPVVHFKGVSRSLDDSWDENANSNIRGMIGLKGSVRLTPEGEVRWTTWSIFSGEERWRSESVQVGGVRSAKGVLGNWFDKDYDPRGPAGPTAFWKISDRVGKTEEPRLMMHDFMSMEDELDNEVNPEPEEMDETGEGEEDDDDDDDDGHEFISELEIHLPAAIDIASILGVGFSDMAEGSDE